MTTPSEPTLVNHAKRHQNARPPAALVKALGLTESQASQLYVSDSQEYSNGCSVVQLHYLANEPVPELQRFRGVAYLLNPLLPDEVATVAKSFPYESPVVSDSFPIGFEAARFSRSRQGFVARVFCPFSTVNVSTHRKIDCEKSHFGQSKFMKEMFYEAAQARGLVVESLFPNAASKRYCHVFFIAHQEMRLLATEDEPVADLVYLGSLVQERVDWADDDEDEAGVMTVRDMVLAEPRLPALEALRPRYYSYDEAQALFAQGQPLIAWVAGRAPTRLVPATWQRKETLRGNVPNLKLAWYTLLDEVVKEKPVGMSAIAATNVRFLEVLPPSQHGVLVEYVRELESALDSTESRHDSDKEPAPGSLVAHLLDRFFVFQGENDAGREHLLEKAGKATGPMLKKLEAYGRKIAPDQRRRRLTKLLRKMLWEQVEAKRVYTLMAEHRRFLALAATGGAASASAPAAAASN